MLADLPLSVINRLLEREAWARKLLQAHAGRCAQLDIGGWMLRFAVDEDGRVRAADAAQASDVSIQVPASALGKLAEGPEALREAAHIEGQAAFAETLALLIQHLRPDPEAWLAPWLGDPLAHRVHRTASTLARSGLETGRRLGEAGVSLLREPDGPLPDRAEFNALREGIAALQARLARLERR